MHGFEAVYCHGLENSKIIKISPGDVLVIEFYPDAENYGNLE